MTDDGSRYSAQHRVDERGGVETWRGIDKTLGRPVTVRVVRDDQDNNQRLKSQIRALARLEHPGLLHVLDTCAIDDGFAIITEQLPVRTVADELADAETLPYRRVLRIARETGAALQALHDHGFAHGGVRAERLAVRPDDSVVLMDGPPTTDALTIPVRPDDDLHGLAVLIHVLAAGGPPRPGPDNTFEIHPMISGQLHTVLARAFDDNGPRWPNVQALVDALPDANDGDDETPQAERGSHFRTERAWLVPVIVVALIAAAVTAWSLLTRGDTTTPAGGDAAKGEVGLDNATTLPDEGSVPTVTAVERRPAPIGALRIVDIADFDPTGDDRAEHPERIAFINDGDSSRGWQTERYTTSDFGNLKPGVGLIVQLGPPQLVDRVVVRSPSIGWGVEVYGSPEAPAGIETWGEPISVATDVSGDAVLAVDGVEAATLLIWIVDLGEPVSAGGHRVTVNGITVSGRPVFG